MERSENILRDVREMQKQMKNKEIASERGGNFLIGSCNQLYPLLGIELFEATCAQYILANLIGSSECPNLIDYCLSVAVLQLTAIYTEVLQIELLEQSTVSLFFFRVFNSNNTLKTRHLFVMPSTQTVAIDFEAFHFSNEPLTLEELCARGFDAVAHGRSFCKIAYGKRPCELAREAPAR